MELSEKQMHEITGGVSWTVVSAIAAGIVYIIGIISGYTNPSRCNN